jgi:hypothetical protein
MYLTEINFQGDWKESISAGLLLASSESRLSQGVEKRPLCSDDEPIGSWQGITS